MALPLLATSLRSQPTAPTDKESNRVKRLREFCQYVKRMESGKLDHQHLFKEYLVRGDDGLESPFQVDPLERQKLLKGVLEDLDGKMNQMNLKAFDAVPWNEFKQPERLPRMVWEAEPVTHLMGQPVPTGDGEQELAEGRKQRENTLVVFEKTQPDMPLYYVLFDEKTDRILSWILIGQGELHYFLLL